MSRYPIFLLGLLIISLNIIPATAEENFLYKDVYNVYYRYDGQTIRWESDREFILQDYSFWTNGSDKFVNITLLHDTQFGDAETITQPVKEGNFIMHPQTIANGSLERIDWDILLFRNTQTTGGDPFNNEERALLTMGPNQRYDLENQPDFFSYNLQYFEYHNDTDGYKILKVNTELSANNEGDGRSIRTAIHIVKKDSNNNIVFDFNREIYQVNTFYRFFNYFDQPFLLVPLRLGGILLVIYLYIRINRYWTENNMKIVREGKEEILEKPEETE